MLMHNSIIQFAAEHCNQDKILYMILSQKTSYHICYKDAIAIDKDDFLLDNVDIHFKIYYIIWR